MVVLMACASYDKRGDRLRGAKGSQVVSCEMDRLLSTCWQAIVVLVEICGFFAIQVRFYSRCIENERCTHIFQDIFLRLNCVKGNFTLRPFNLNVFPPMCWNGRERYRELLDRMWMIKGRWRCANAALSNSVPMELGTYILLTKHEMDQSGEHLDYHEK